MESYVDDSKLYLTIPLKEANTAMAQLSENLKNIVAWLCSNSLLIIPLTSIYKAKTSLKVKENELFRR